GQLGGIALVDEVDEVHALHHPTAGDVEAGDDAATQHGRPPGSGRRNAPGSAAPWARIARGGTGYPPPDPTAPRRRTGTRARRRPSPRRDRPGPGRTSVRSTPPGRRCPHRGDR